MRNTTSWAKNISFAQNAAVAAASQPFDIVHGLSRSPSVDTFRLTDPLQAHWLNVYYPTRTRWLQKLNPRHRALLGLERSIYRSEQVRRVIVQSTLDAELIQTYYHVPRKKFAAFKMGSISRPFISNLARLCGRGSI